MKKNTLIFIVIACIVIAGATAFWFYSTKTSTHKLEQISGEKIFSSIIDTEGKNIKYYSPYDNALHQLNLETKVASTISEGIFENIEGIIWSPNASQFIMQIIGIGQETQNGENVLISDPSLSSFWLYNLTNKVPILLNQNISTIIWNNDGEKILYHYLDTAGQTNNISLSLPNGRSFQKIVDVNEKNIYMKIADKNTLIYSLNNPTKNWTKVNLVSKKTEVIALSQEFDLSKTAWLDENTFVTAMREKGTESDVFCLVNLGEKKTETLNAKPKIKKLDAKNLFLSPDHTLLYFTNDNLLYKLAIK